MAELPAMSAEERARFRREVVDRLAALAEDTRALLAELEALPDVESEPFLAELRDGVAIDLARTEFARALWDGALRAASGDDPSAAESAMDRALSEARTIVMRRHAALFDPDPSEILATRRTTALLYRYGYLREAETLCFWERERIQYRREFRGDTAAVPPCVL